MSLERSVVNFLKRGMQQERKETEHLLYMSENREFASLDYASKCNYNGNELKLDVGLEYGKKLLFRLSSIALQHGHVYGLVAPNGAGKSSLADVLRAKLIPGFPQTLSISSVKTDSDFDSEFGELSVKDFLLENIRRRETQVLEQISELELLLEENDNDDEVEKLVERTSRLYDTLDSFDLLSREKSVEDILSELGFLGSCNQHVAVSKLSGGWRMRCQLAKAALSAPEFLIVDEPSFLDEKATAWFVNYLRNAAKEGAVVLLITHKEPLVRLTCDRILHITADKDLKQFNGNYDSFKVSEAQDTAVAEASKLKLTKKQEAFDKTTQNIKQKLQKREKNVDVLIRVKHADKRFIAGRSMEKKQRSGKSIAAKRKQLLKEKEKTNSLQKKNVITTKLKIVGEKSEQGDMDLISFSGVTFGYDNHLNLFEAVDLSLASDDRVALVAPNGSGKSTLVKLLVGELHPREGKITSRFPTQPIYFPQNAAEDMVRKHGNMNPTEFVSLFSASEISSEAIRKHLADFALQGDVVFQKIKELSTGQRVRLYIAKEYIIHRSPKLLILDEVSDNLDTETVKLLIESLKDFPGAIIAISHEEEEFLAEFATKRWNIKDKKISATHLT